MKIDELRKMSISELNTELISLLKVQFGLRMQKATQQLTNTQQISKVKKDVARIKTIISEKLNGQHGK